MSELYTTTITLTIGQFEADNDEQASEVIDAYLDRISFVEVDDDLFKVEKYEYRCESDISLFKVTTS